MIVSLIVLVVIAVGAIATAAVALLVDMRRREAVRRAAGGSGPADEGFRSVLIDAGGPADESPIDRVITVMGGLVEDQPQDGQ